VLAVQAGDVPLAADHQDAIGDFLQRSAQPARPICQALAREREILHLVLDGKTSAEIAVLLFLSPKAVESYRSRMMHKLGVRDLPSLVKFAVQEGLLS
jgi:DNA-binding NarL/FixJ family response regulator